MGTRGNIRAAAAVLILALAPSLAGCSLLAAPPPPDVVTRAVDRAMTAIRLIDGVASATSQISQRDPEAGGALENPAAWDASIAIVAQPNPADLGAMSVSVVHAIESARGTVSTSGILQLPADMGGSKATLAFTKSPPGQPTATPAALVAATVSLRGITGARSVSASTGGGPAGVQIDSPSQWPALVAELRSLRGFGHGVLASARVNIPVGGWLTVDAVSPSPSVIPFLSELTTQTGVNVSYDGTPPFGASEAWRPALNVQVLAEDPAAAKADVQRITGLLTHLDDAQAQVDGVPRASFSVYSYRGSSSLETRGYLGLPLGSAEPDDRNAPTTSPTTPPTDGPVSLAPADAAAKLQSDRGSVTTLLDAAGDIAGIRGTSDVTIVPCTAGPGEAISGSVVIPIFTISDSANKAFGAITASWESNGYHWADRATGTDFYGPNSSSGGLRSLSIRGTTDGISIHAVSECVASG